MANYPELRTRYARVRALEEREEGKRKVGSGLAEGGEVEVPRVRFVNYYTVSSGYVKRRAGSGSLKSRDSLAPSVVRDDGRTRSENDVLRPSSLPQIPSRSHPHLAFDCIFLCPSMQQAKLMPHPNSHSCVIVQKSPSFSVRSCQCQYQAKIGRFALASH